MVHLIFTMKYRVASIKIEHIINNTVDTNLDRKTRILFGAIMCYILLVVFIGILMDHIWDPEFGNVILLELFNGSLSIILVYLLCDALMRMRRCSVQGNYQVSNLQVGILLASYILFALSDFLPMLCKDSKPQ